MTINRQDDKQVPEVWEELSLEERQQIYASLSTHAQRVNADCEILHNWV